MGRGHRALRGGSWNNNENNARVSGRNNNNPNNRNNNIGFRVVVLALHRGVFHAVFASSMPEPPEGHRDDVRFSIEAQLADLAPGWAVKSRGQPNTQNPRLFQ
jgi:hypothetical protein